jgi:hypothetical protein
MPVDYQMPAFQTPQGSEGNVLSGIIAQAIQQRQQGQRLGMEKTQFNDQRKQASQALQARQAVTVGLKKIQSDPNLTPSQKSEQARNLLLQHAVSSGGSVSGLTPQIPKQPSSVESVPLGTSQPGMPPVPPNGPANFPGMATARGVSDPNTGSLTFPPALNPKAPTPLQQSQEALNKARADKLTNPNSDPKAMTPFQTAETERWKQQDKAKEEAAKGKMPDIDKLKYTHLLTERSKLDTQQVFGAKNKAAHDEAVKSIDSKIDELEKKHSGEPAKAAPVAAPAQTATNPKTGEKLQLIDGKWQPIPKAQ